MLSREKSRETSKLKRLVGPKDPDLGPCNDVHIACAETLKHTVKQVNWQRYSNPGN